MSQQENSLAPLGKQVLSWRKMTKLNKTMSFDALSQMGLVRSFGIFINRRFLHIHIEKNTNPNKCESGIDFLTDS